MSFSPRSSRFPALNPRTGMLTIALVGLLMLGAIAAIVIFTLREERPDGRADRITLAMPATDGPPESTDGDIITHLSITGRTQEQVDMSLYLTDMEGRNLMPDPPFTATVDLTNLNSGATVDGLVMSPVAGTSTPTFILNEPGIKSEGWWHVQTMIERPDGNPLESDFYILLPDPNIAGFQAPPTPDSDPDATQMLTTAITQMGEWESLRWWEWLSGGNDSLIMANYAVTTTEANGQPDSFRSDMLYAAGFQRRPDGTPLAAPARDHLTRVTIGDQAWSRNEDGEITERPPSQYLPIEQYPETYRGADQVRFGIEEQVDGRTAQIVTFHVPGHSAQSQAWYASWIDVETGEILKLAMVAHSHYMLWSYSDVNEPFVIHPPEGVEYVPATPSATPAASPAGLTATTARS